MSALSVAKRIYMTLESRTPLRGVLYRYRHRIYTYLPPKLTIYTVARAAVLALPGAHRILGPAIRLRRRFSRVRDSASSSLALPSVYPIDLDSNAREATTLAELMAPGRRRASFEIYRNALYLGMVNAMQEVTEDYAAALAIGLSELPTAELLKEFSGAVDAGAQYERLLRLAIDFDPSMAEAHFMLARRLLAVGREDEALHHFRLAAYGKLTVELSPHDAPVNAKAFFEIGSYYLRKAAITQAVPFLERAVELWPAFPPANLALGRALLRCGRYEQGAKQCLAGLKYANVLPTLPSFARRFDAASDQPR